jgi:RNA polymerase sigma-70 factor (ECF subfamily)
MSGHLDRARRQAVLSGDTVVWSEWLAEVYDGVASYVRWRCGGLEDLAEDVVQETWLIAVSRLRTFEPERSPFTAWVCGIAANIVRNRLRARRRDRCRPMVEATATPESNEVRERVAEALDALPEVYEQVLRAKYLDGRSVEEIARLGNETEKAVESRLTRARQAFREVYERENRDDRTG